MQISKNISYKEAVYSNTASKLGIDNTPSPATLERMKLVANKVFQPIREHFGVPIKVTSFYRSPKLNKAVGGSKTSQHVLGEAMDLKGTNGVTNKQIYDFIKSNLEFDQLIWEYGTDKEPSWVHVSYRKGKNRKQTLRIK